MTAAESVTRSRTAGCRRPRRGTRVRRRRERPRAGDRRRPALAPYVGVSLMTYTGIIGVILAGIALGAWLGGRAADAFGPLPLIGPAFIVGGISAIARYPSSARSAGRAGRRAGRASCCQQRPVRDPGPGLSAIGPMLVRGTLTNSPPAASIVGRLSAIGDGGAITGTFLTGSCSWDSCRLGILIVSVGLGLAVVGAVLTGGCGPWSRDRIACSRRRPGPAADLPRVAVSVQRRKRLLLHRDQDGPCRTGRADPGARQPHPRRGRPARPNESPSSAIFGGSPMRRPRSGPGSVGHRRPPHRRGRVHVPAVPRGDIRRRGRPSWSSIRACSKSPRPSSGIRRAITIDGPARRCSTVDPRAPIRRLRLVIGDAFGGLAVPWHLTTTEFLDEVARVLRPDGAYVANLIDYPPLGFFRAEAATAATRFAKSRSSAANERSRAGPVATSCSWPATRPIERSTVEAAIATWDESEPTVVLAEPDGHQGVHRLGGDPDGRFRTRGPIGPAGPLKRGRVPVPRPSESASSGLSG